MQKPRRGADHARPESKSTQLPDGSSTAEPSSPPIRAALRRWTTTVGPLGYGAFKIGRNQKTKYDGAYQLPTDADAVRLLHEVLDLGVSFFDTAPAYGSSEERLGAAFADRRDRVTISTKVGEAFGGPNGEATSTYDYSSGSVRRSLQRSLRLLRTDYVDNIFVHSNGDDLRIQCKTDVVNTLLDLRAAGLTRTIGFSGKTPEGAMQALTWADVLMVEYHPEDTSHDVVLREAAVAGVSVVVKKGLDSGRLSPKLALPFILANPAVDCVVVGVLSVPHMEENLRLALESRVPSRPQQAVEPDVSGRRVR